MVSLCGDLQLLGRSGLGAFTDGAVGTSKVTSGKCTVSIEKKKRFEYGSNQDGRVRERKVYVKLYCVYICTLTCGVDRDPPGKCSVI